MYNKNNGYNPYGTQYSVKPPYTPTYPYGSTYAPSMGYSTPTMANTMPNQMPYENTNHIFVTSLEDALSRNAPPNSEIGYLHQDKPLLFNIKTDNLGKKTYTTYELKEYSAESKEEPPKETVNLDNYVTFEKFNTLVGDFENLKQSFNKMLNAIKTKNKGETTNE